MKPTITLELTPFEAWVVYWILVDMLPAKFDTQKQATNRVLNKLSMQRKAWKKKEVA